MNQNTIWQSVIGELEVSIQKASFDSIFKKIKLVSIRDNEVKISVPNVFIQSYLEKKYQKIMTELFKKNGIKKPKFVYSTNFKTSEQPLANTINYKKREEVIIQTPKSASFNSGLNPRYTFDNFIVGSCNDFAYSAAQAVASNPGLKYNPLFLYSGVGLGKTHLMQAVGNQISQNNPQSRILYITVETFVKEFLDAIRFKKKGFSDKYRNVDVLIVDDMQFIANKEKTQEEFFHTFNDLHQNNKQIIISSDKPPKNIPTLTERLRSRFEWGMTVDMQMPDYETRCAIVDIKANLSNTQLDSQTIEYFANNYKTNVRELEGALNQLLAFAEMRQLKPDVETAKGFFEQNKKSRPHYLTAKQVVGKTARYFNLETEQICSPSRSKEIVVPRQIAMFLLRSELHLSFPNIARELGRKDHTTAIHSVEKIEKEIKLNPIIRENIASLRDIFYN